jgi:4-hydroxy-tetrahydrodipicolinate synthase
MDEPGLIVAPLTPFTRDLAVDEAALAREIDHIIKDSRPTMIVAAGVEAQEYTYLSLEERKALIRRTIECVGGRCPVMVGISHPSFRTAIALAHYAEALGAAAVQMLAPLRPHGGVPTERDLIAYFEAVGRETALAITLYLNPGPGAEVSIPATIALAQLDKVRFIKESSRDLARVSRLIVEIDHAGHAKYFTTMQMLLASIELGGAGATMPPPASTIARRIIDAFIAALSRALDASRPDADDEGGDADHRHSRGRPLPALCRARRRRDEGACDIPRDHGPRREWPRARRRLGSFRAIKRSLRARRVLRD